MREKIFFLAGLAAVVVLLWLLERAILALVELPGADEEMFKEALDVYRAIRWVGTGAVAALLGMIAWEGMA